MASTGDQIQPSDDNEQRIDGDGQEVNALRFLIAGAPPAQPPPAITPVSSGVSQPLQPQQQPPPPAPTPLQPSQASQPHPQQPIQNPGGYDFPDPSGYGSMQMPPVPMSGPYGMPGQVPGVMGGGPMMMMPPYNYPMYNPYMFPGPYPSMPSAPSNSSSQFLAMLNVLRVKDPKFYREWYKKYTAHKRNPDRVPFPQIPGFPSMGGPGSSATLPSYGRTRKESSRSSVNGDSFRHAQNESFSNLDYSHGPGGGANTSMSHTYPRNHDRRNRQQPDSGRTSVNGDYRQPEDDFEIDGADMSVLSGAGGNSMLNTSHYVGERDRLTQSGRSSTVGEPYNRLPPGDVYGGYPDQQQQQPDSLGYDNGYGFQPITEQAQAREPSPRRMTPLKFSTFHCIAAMSPLGHLIRIKNTGTTLEFLKMKQFVGHLPEYKEMESYPGPLTPGSTHKNTVIQFCRRKIKEARSNNAQHDKENYILLWEFLMLMLRQNGMVVGSDIAELLLSTAQQEEKKVTEVENERDDVEGSEEGEEEESSPPKVDPPAEPEVRDEEKLIQQFCEHLLYGHKKDALDFAMDNGLWGHALFFASKMDERSYGHVLARFANGIALNSPLQTLYHIMCGKQPASVTSCSEESFGDWKPHLAMLLSNSGYKPEVEQKAILTLGDTLASRNHIFAAQFCYLMGHEEFRKDSRLGPLLGFTPGSENYLEATQMTEVYEFARKLADPTFSLGPSFLHSKLDYAKSLVSYGFVQEALAYCEEITKTLKSRRIDETELKLCTNTLQISERIAVADESGLANSTWVEDLRKIIYDPSIFSGDQSRKLSLVSSSQEHGSDQLSYTSQSQQAFQQQQQQLTQSHDLYDQYNNIQNQNVMGSDVNSPGVSQFETAASSNNVSNTDPDSSYSGVPELPQENNWANSNQMNGGLHMSSPPQMYDVNQQQTQQMPLNSASATNVYTNNGMDGNYQSMDAGYSSGVVGYDKQSGAPPTANNNYWYNPYDSQPQPSGSANNDYGSSKDQPDSMNTAAVKKKSVRFEDEHERHADVENSLGNDVQSVLRSRVPIRLTDPVDLKSAMKSAGSSDREDVEKKLKQSNVMNEKSSVEGSTHSIGSSENDIDVETCGSPDQRSLLDVEYKSTYPIDEPIEPRLAPNCNTSKIRSQTASQPSSPTSSTFEYHNHSNSKTFPVDKECCDVNEPCEEHDDYLGDDTEGLLNGTQDISSQYSGFNYEKKTEPASKNQSAQQSSGGERKGPDKKKAGKDIIGGDQQKGWFSGLFKTLTLKPKNQMILPDDKNPTIVWDDKEKRWVNTAADGESDSAPAGPPPKDSDLMGKPNPPPMSNGPMSPPSNMNPMQPAPPNPNMPQNNMSYQATPQAALHSLPTNNHMPAQQVGMMKQPQPANTNEPMIPGMPPVSNNSMNKYKLQKGRSLKNSYVDVLNPNGARASNEPPSLPVNNMSAPQLPNMFIPPPSNQPGDGPVSFLTAAAPSEDVPPGQDALTPAPPMFNPAQFQNVGYPQGQ